MKILAIKLTKEMTPELVHDMLMAFYYITLYMHMHFINYQCYSHA